MVGIVAVGVLGFGNGDVLDGSGLAVVGLTLTGLILRLVFVDDAVARW